MISGTHAALVSTMAIGFRRASRSTPRRGGPPRMHHRVASTRAICKQGTLALDVPTSEPQATMSADMTRATYSAISLYSGAGGMDLGFARVGFDIRWAIDNDPFAVRT